MWVGWSTQQQHLHLLLLHLLLTLTHQLQMFSQVFHLPAFILPTQQRHLGSASSRRISSPAPNPAWSSKWACAVLGTTVIRIKLYFRGQGALRLVRNMYQAKVQTSENPSVLVAFTWARSS